jgi:hypothetical protein
MDEIPSYVTEKSIVRTVLVGMSERALPQLERAMKRVGTLTRAAKEATRAAREAGLPDAALAQADGEWGTIFYCMCKVYEAMLSDDEVVFDDEAEEDASESMSSGRLDSSEGEGQSPKDKPTCPKCGAFNWEWRLSYWDMTKLMRLDDGRWSQHDKNYECDDEMVCLDCKTDIKTLDSEGAVAAYDALADLDWVDDSQRE